METPLQSASLTADELSASIAAEHEVEYGADEEEGHGHAHLPVPSLWPLISTVAIALTVGGLIFWTEGNVPWLSIIAAPFILVGIIGWGLEDPTAPAKEEARPEHLITTYAEAAATGKPTTLAEAVLHDAEEVADRTVTVSSSAWSAHPVHIEVEREGVVLALYGKVELEAQRKELEEELLKLPGVIDVKNFLVAEDAILNEANARIEKLKAEGKLEGAKDLSLLVENYIVSLYGEVPNREMKYMLENELLSIPKVRVVINRIGLNEDIPGNLGKTRNKVGN